MKRVVGVRLFAAVVTLVVAVLGTTWWFTRGPAVPVQHEPVSVLIADFQNTSNDPTFDRTLEPILKIALEGAGFISAFDRSGVGPISACSHPRNWTRRAAREIAAEAGSGCCRGRLDRAAGQRLRVVGESHASGDRQGDRDRAANGLRARTGPGVGNETGDRRFARRSATTRRTRRKFAMETLSATSLDVVRHYAAGDRSAVRTASSRRRCGAIRKPSSWIRSLAWVTRAWRSRRGISDRQQDAEKYIEEALKQLDGMTERERYRTRARTTDHE